METIRSTFSQWSKSSQLLYLLLRGLVGITLILFIILWFFAERWGIPITESFSFFPKAIPVDEVKLGIFSFQIFADTYISQIRFDAGLLHLPVWMDYLYLAGLGLVLAAITAVSVRFERTPFLIVLGIIILILASFRLDSLMLFGSYRNIGLYISMGLVIGLAYYFHAFSRDFPVFYIWIIFSLLWIALLLLFFFKGETANPLSHFIAGTYLLTFFVAILFIFTVGHEIPAALLRLVTQSRGSNSFFHFLGLTVIYLTILTLSLLAQMGLISKDWLYLDPLWIILISGFLGIKGVWDRRTFFSWFRGYYPALVIIFLAVFGLTLITFSLHLGRLNDPAVEVLQDAILYSHIGFGFSFLLYIIANFRNPLAEGAPVYRVLYQPDVMPYFSYRFFGLVLVAGLFYYSGMVPLSQARSGFFNMVGDAFFQEREWVEAETYYLMSRNYEPFNHHANYAMASMARIKNDPAELFYLSRGVRKNPLPQDFLATARVYREKDRFFDAVFAINDGLAKFPSNGPLNNNLGLLYSETNILDSAWFFLEKARNTEKTADEALTNMLGAYARHAQNKVYRVDSLIDLGTIQTPAQRMNYLSWYNKFAIPVETEAPDSVKKMADFYLAYNSRLNQIFDPEMGVDTTSYRVGGIPDIQLAYLDAIALYQKGDQHRAYRNLDATPEVTPLLQNYKYRTLGLWSLDQGEPDLAASFIRNMIGEDQSFYLLSISYLLAGKNDMARESFKKVRVNNPGVNTFGKILNSEPGEMGDTLELAWYYFHPEQLDSVIAKKCSNMQFYPPLERKIEYSLRNFLVDSTKEYVSFLPPSLRSEKEFLIKAYEEDWQAALDILRVSQIKTPMRDVLQYCQEGDTIKARSALISAARKNPFEEVWALLAMEILEDELEIYNLILGMLEINPYHPLLIKSYCKQAVRTGLERYAFSELEAKKDHLTEQTYSKIRNDILEEEQKQRENLNW